MSVASHGRLIGSESKTIRDLSIMMQEQSQDQKAWVPSWHGRDVQSLHHGGEVDLVQRQEGEGTFAGSAEWPQSFAVSAQRAREVHVEARAGGL